MSNAGTDTATGAASGALSGAVAGSVIPGLGTAAGAVIGGVIGGVSGYLSGSAEDTQADKAAAAEAAYQQAISQYQSGVSTAAGQAITANEAATMQYEQAALGQLQWMAGQNSSANLQGSYANALNNEMAGGQQFAFKAPTGSGALGAQLQQYHQALAQGLNAPAAANTALTQGQQAETHYMDPIQLAGAQQAQTVTQNQNTFSAQAAALQANLAQAAAQYPYAIAQAQLSAQSPMQTSQYLTALQRLAPGAGNAYNQYVNQQGLGSINAPLNFNLGYQAQPGNTAAPQSINDFNIGYQPSATGGATPIANFNALGINAMGINDTGTGN